MARLPGKAIPGTSIKKLSCGCLVKFWPVTGMEVLHRCTEHQKIADAEWAQTSPVKKTLIYTVFAIFIGIPTLATIILLLYVFFGSIYQLIFK